MSLASVLTRPQLLSAPQRAADERPPNALLDVLTRLAREVTTGGKGLEIVEQELVASLEALAGEVQPRLQAARTRLQPLADALTGLVDDALGSPAGADGFERVVAEGRGLTEALATVLGGLTSARIGELVGTLFDVVETDLGLTEARFRTFFGETIERIATRLQAEYLAGDSSAYNRYALGAAVRELRGLMGQALGLPPFDRTTLLPLLTEQLQELDFDDRLSNIAGVATRIGQGLSALEALEKLFPGGSFASGAPNGAARAAAAPARLVTPARPATSGLLAAAAPSGTAAAAADDVFAWYASWLKGELVFHPDPLNNPDLADIDFGTVSASALEGLARHTMWLTTLGEVALHVSSVRKGDFVSNMMNAIFLTVESLVNLTTNEDLPRWVKWLFRILMTTLGGLERARFNDWFGILLMLSDMAEAQLYARWTWLAREAQLSILTLINNKTGRANHNQVEGLGHLCGELGNLFMALIFARARKKDYGFPAGPGLGSWGITIGYLLAGIGANISLTLLGGGVLASVFSGKAPDTERVFRLLLKDRIFGRGTGGLLIPQVLATLILHITDFYIYYYMFAENLTAGGKLTGKPKGDLEFPGYPNRADSPYRLPWEKGKLYECAQGNHGLFSHTPFSFDLELYAFDFSFNHGDDVLAMRDGVIWDFTDTNADGNTDFQNEIIILHETPAGGTDPLSGHDFDENGTPARTFTSYLHGKQGSVVGAFPLTITKDKDAPGLGTKVKRGQVIMLADDTGRSAYNHLHVTVKPMDPTSGVTATVALAFPAGTTLPSAQPIAAIAPVLQAALRGAVPTNPVFSDAIVLVSGNRLVVVPGGNASGGGLTFAASGGNAAVTALRLDPLVGADTVIGRRSGPHPSDPVIPASPTLRANVGGSVITVTLTFPAGTSLPGPQPLSAIAPVLQAGIRSAGAANPNFNQAIVTVIGNRLVVIPSGGASSGPFFFDNDGSNRAATALRLTPGEDIARAVVTRSAAHTGNPTVPASPVVSATIGALPADYTIPFVFGDADLTHDKGVPRSAVWYDSDNVKVV
jgi:hypothetical protein